MLKTQLKLVTMYIIHLVSAQIIFSLC